MDTVDIVGVDKQLESARQIIAGMELPPEVEGLSVRVGPDSFGEPSLWLELQVGKNVDALPAEVRKLTEFARQVQSRLIDSGITLFPYTSLEQAA